MNKVASGKNIRSTLSLLNVSAECEVIRARNSVKRHSVEIQNAEDLPFSRGKRPHIEQQTTSIDGQTATLFISQFKFNTAVPNTTTGIKEPHHLELELLLCQAQGRILLEVIQVAVLRMSRQDYSLS